MIYQLIDGQWWRINEDNYMKYGADNLSKPECFGSERFTPTGEMEHQLTVMLFARNGTNIEGLRRWAWPEIPTIQEMEV